MPTVVARLPEALRDDLKAPIGPVFTDADELLALVDGRLVAIGDVVTAHLVRAGRRPDLAVVDERTQRGPVDVEIRENLGEPETTVENPAATLTAELIEAMQVGLANDEPTTILVDGEEDLAVLPALLLAPTGASVVYGQPGEGMVLVGVSAATRERARRWLERMANDPEHLFALLDD